jgi:signal transduction histidine kinase
LNNKKDVELVKAYIEKGIEVRHIKDLLTNSFSLSDKAFLFPIGKIEEKGTRKHSVLISNDQSYLNHYDYLFEKLWKKGIDIHTRIKDIEEGYCFNIETIPNPEESLKFYKKVLKSVKYEILIMLASSSAFFRFEKNIGYKALEELSNNKIKVKILFPAKVDLNNEIYQIKTKYPKIDFRILPKSLESFIGLTIIDKLRVLINEVKDDTKINYIDVIGMTIHIEGKSTAISYATIFNSLWKQAELYDEIEKAYEKIQIHDKMQRDFINVAAHELRTPIQPIIGFTQILGNKITDKEQLGFLDIINRNTKRLKKLSEDILEVSKIENSLLNLNKENFKIKELILQIISDFKKEAETKNIEFELIDQEQNDSFVNADREKISQILSNIVSNSIKFIDDEKDGGARGKISILSQKMTKEYEDDDTCIDKNVIVISIKDNGAGIDKDVLPTLFSKFASKSFQGTGLGLYICKSIVEAHGGKIWAKNNNEDGKKGATFYFSLPLDN